MSDIRFHHKSIQNEITAHLCRSCSERILYAKIRDTSMYAQMKRKIFILTLPESIISLTFQCSSIIIKDFPFYWLYTKCNFSETNEHRFRVFEFGPKFCKNNNFRYELEIIFLNRKFKFDLEAPMLPEKY